MQSTQIATTTRMANLSAIVYRSRAVGPVSDTDLFYLLAQARDRNGRLGVSGIVLYDRGFFFQWIEGENAHLGAIWNSIRNDRRHTDLQVLVDQEIPTRLFPGWHMQFAHRDRQHENIVDGFTVADLSVLDDLHLNEEKIPNILASFSRLSGASAPPRAPG